MKNHQKWWTCLQTIFPVYSYKLLVCYPYLPEFSISCTNKGQDYFSSGLYFHCYQRSFVVMIRAMTNVFFYSNSFLGRIAVPLLRLRFLMKCRQASKQHSIMYLSVCVSYGRGKCLLINIFFIVKRTVRRCDSNSNACPCTKYNIW